MLNCTGQENATAFSVPAPGSYLAQCAPALPAKLDGIPAIQYSTLGKSLTTAPHHCFSRPIRMIRSTNAFCGIGQSLHAVSRVTR